MTYANNEVQKCVFFEKSCKNIWSYQKKAVPLQSLLRKTGLVGLIMCTKSCTRFVSLAQLVEQLTLNQWVEGSSPSGDTQRGKE